MNTATNSGTQPSETPAEIRHQVRVEYRIYLVIVALISLIVGGIMGMTLFRDDRGDVGVETVQQASSTGQETVPVPDANNQHVTLAVYVSGAVNSAQVVTLAQGSLVIDAITAAGGPSSDANLDAINLAAPVSDHEHVFVPGYADPDMVIVQPAAVLLNINTATIAELETLPHIGTVRAQQIVTYRDDHGLYQKKEDIMEVSGIGPAIYEEISPFITVDVK